MVRLRVTSSNLSSVGYDGDAQLLEVEFHSGSVYQFRRVPETVHQRLMAAGSKGSFFNDHIKGRYGCSRVS